MSPAQYYISRGVGLSIHNDCVEESGPPQLSSLLDAKPSLTSRATPPPNTPFPVPSATMAALCFQKLHVAKGCLLRKSQWLWKGILQP